MNRIIFTIFFLLIPAAAGAATPAEDLARLCDAFGTYSLKLIGCPNYTPDANTAIPLCEQPALEHLSYLDFRCYDEIPFDYTVRCYDWECPAPYDHVFIESRSGKRAVLRGDTTEIDAHYRAARQSLGGYDKPKKKKSSKR